MAQLKVLSRILYHDVPPQLLLHPQNDDTGLYKHLSGIPKALLPGIGGKKILDFWWETVNM